MLFSPVEIVTKEIERIKQVEKQVLEDLSQAEHEAEWIIKKAKEKAQKEAEGIRRQAHNYIAKLLAEAKAQGQKEAKKIENQGKKRADRIRQGAVARIEPTAKKIVEVLLE